MDGNFDEDEVEDKYARIVLVLDEFITMGYRVNLTDGFVDNLLSLYSGNENLYENEL